LSIEPIEEEILLDHFEPTAINWIILGGQSGPGEKFYPSLRWLFELSDFCIDNGIPLFIKDNFKFESDVGIFKPTKRQEWPEVKR
jgi:protein gp37